MSLTAVKLGPQLRKIAKTELGKVEKVVRSSFIELGTNIITSTPVDEGRLIANWMVAIGSADTSTTTDTDVSGGESMGRLTQKVSALDLGQELYMTNSLPYAERIEYEGHSSQKAPAGMVRVNVADWTQIVNRNAAAYL